MITPAVVIWRSMHALIAIGFLSSIGYVWWCALTGRCGRWLRLAIAALAGEGVLVVANRGDCPLGPLGDRIGRWEYMTFYLVKRTTEIEGLNRLGREGWEAVAMVSSWGVGWRFVHPSSC